jgi:hypothetical protein
VSAAPSMWDRPVGYTCTVLRGASTVRLRSARALVPGWRTLATWDTFEEARAGAKMHRALENLAGYVPSRAWVRRYAITLTRVHAAEIKAKRLPAPCLVPVPGRPVLRSTLDSNEWSDVIEAVRTAGARKRLDFDALDDIRQKVASVWLARPGDLPATDRIKWLVGVAKNLVAMVRRERATHRRILREGRYNFRERRTGNYAEDDLIDFLDRVHAFERQWAIDHPTAPPLRTVAHSFSRKNGAGAMSFQERRT